VCFCVTVTVRTLTDKQNNKNKSKFEKIVLNLLFLTANRVVFKSYNGDVLCGYWGGGGQCMDKKKSFHTCHTYVQLTNLDACVLSSCHSQVLNYHAN